MLVLFIQVKKSGFQDRGPWMLKRFAVVVFLILTTACAPHTQYAWQDATGLAREDATPDLETCRNFTARQYRAGVPAGETYLKKQEYKIDYIYHEKIKNSLRFP